MYRNAARPFKLWIRTTLPWQLNSNIKFSFKMNTCSFSTNIPETDLRACAIDSTCWRRSRISLRKPLVLLHLNRGWLPGLSTEGVMGSVPDSSIAYNSNVTKQQFSSKAGETTIEAKKEFSLFYQFPYIVSMRALSRLKIYQTVAMAGFLPVLKHMEMTGSVSSELFWSFTGLTGFSCMMLYVMSYYFRRLVGLMSLNESEGTVKVSHLTFWGNRKDLFIPVDEIVPLADLEDETSDIYIKLRRYDSSDYLFYTIRFGYVRDIEAFKKVFGETWTRK